MKRAQTLLKAIVGSAVLLLAGGLNAQTDVVIATEIDGTESGDTATSGTRLRVLVKVSDSFTTHQPHGVAVKVTFPEDSLSWGFDPGSGLVTVEQTDDVDGPGPLQPWSIVASLSNTPEGGALVSRRISTAGGAIGLLPQAFYMNFTVGGTGNALPYTIEIESDDQSSNPVPVILAPSDPGGPAVLALTPDYDYAATTNVSVSEWMILE